MNKIDLIKKRLTSIETQKESLAFPQLLFAYRKAFGSTRRSVCQDMGMREMRMFTFENGIFGNGIKDEEMEKISTYYGIDKDFLTEKAICFLAERKGSSSKNLGLEGE